MYSHQADLKGISTLLFQGTDQWWGGIPRVWLLQCPWTELWLQGGARSLLAPGQSSWAFHWGWRDKILDEETTQRRKFRLIYWSWVQHPDITLRPLLTLNLQGLWRCRYHSDRRVFRADGSIPTKILKSNFFIMLGHSEGRNPKSILLALACAQFWPSLCLLSAGPEGVRSLQHPQKGWVGFIHYAEGQGQI